MPENQHGNNTNLRDSAVRNAGGTLGSQMDSKSNLAMAGRYRLRETVQYNAGLVVARRPLVVTRVNDAAKRVLNTLTSDSYQSPKTVATAADLDPAAVARLLDGLHDRGFLEWQPMRDESYQPAVTVVVTVRNDIDHLRTCLDAIAALEYPKYDVVIVDDGSTEDTRSVVENCDCPTTLVEVGQPNAPIGIGASRNRGVEAATNDVVAFTDADCRPRPDWLSELVPALASHDVVGGRVRPVGNSGMSAYEAVNSSLDMGSRAGRVRRDGETPYLPTANILAHASTFKNVGFPDQSIAEDVNFCWNALASGFDVVYDPRGIVEHDYGSGERFRQRRQSYGASEALLATDFPTAGAVPVPVVPMIAIALVAISVAVLPIKLESAIAGLTIGFTAVVGGNVWLICRRSDGLVGAVQALRSLGRRVTSAAYAIAREVTRYYSLPAMAIACLIAPVSLAASALLASLVGLAAALPALVEFLLYRPSTGPLGYGWYYFRDHFAYQWGAYSGAVAHNTLAHLDPARRFRF